MRNPLDGSVGDRGKSRGGGLIVVSIPWCDCAIGSCTGARSHTVLTFFTGLQMVQDTSRGEYFWMALEVAEVDCQTTVESFGYQHS